MVEAHCEDSERERAKAPDLLWNPQNSMAIDRWVRSEPVTNVADAHLTEERYSNHVEGMGQCSLELWRDSFMVNDLLGARHATLPSERPEGSKQGCARLCVRSTRLRRSAKSAQQNAGKNTARVGNHKSLKSATINGYGTATFRILCVDLASS